MLIDGDTMRGLCIGNVSYDITLPVADFPIENTKTRIKTKMECGGGPACNAAYLLAKWGLNTSFVGAVGDDYYGEKIEQELKDIGIDLTYFEKQANKQTTSSYIIANTKKGSRTILTNKDPNLSYSKKHLDIKFRPDVILVDGEELDISKQCLLSNPQAISILDAGSIRPSTIELGPLVTYFICSKDFAEKYTNVKIDINNLSTLIEAYNKLKKDFKNNVIITLEEAGCFTKINDYELIPSIKVTPVDSTGAGDIFHGAFAYFISHDYSLKDSLKLANITGAISVTRIGSRYSIPTLEEIINIAKEYDVLS